MQTDRPAPPSNRLGAAVWALLVTQLVHGFTPADTSSEGWFGAAVGAILLVGTAVATVGLRARSTSAPDWPGSPVRWWHWASSPTTPRPLHSPVANPYVDEPIGTPAWISVALAVAAGRGRLARDG